MCNWIRIVIFGLCIWLAACGGADDDSSFKANQPSSQRATIQSVKPLSQLEKTKTGFYYPTGAKKIDFMNGWWLSKDPDYLSGKYHLGVDMKLGYGEPVYAIGKGKLWFISDSGWDLSDVQNPKNCAAVVKHELHDSSKFTVVYGHLLCETLVFKIGGAEINAGDVIGYIGDWGNADHLHFGIVPPGESWSDGGTLGMRPVSHWVTNCAKVKDCSNGFTDPVHFIETEWAYDRPQEVQASCQGGICWKPQGATCESASEWYRLASTTAPYRGVSAGREVCQELQEKMQYITSAPNPQERVLEDKWWQRWFRKAWKFLGLGETASAAEAQALSGYVDKITLQVSTGEVTVPWSIDQEGVGRGLERFMAEPPAPEPPDFVGKRVWLVTPWGTEVYKYGLGENFDTKAQFANIGDGPCKSGEVSTITVHFYLSKGYKEDAHSGDGAWRRLDSATIQCDNLQPGDTHTETKNTVISQWITEPGIHNVVACVDHPQDDHNNGGDHIEKHESNNCTTEAVFEVTANQIENVPNVDFTVSGFTVLQAPVYAGDYIRLGAWITNAGTVNATTDIRSSYTVSCNGGPTSVLTDDGTMASTMTAGASAWEEILTPVLMPNVVGTCTLTFTADYLGAQAETDETNNSTSITVTLAPRPAPNLVITRYEDKVGCCTTNTGAAPKPRIWIRNDGSAAPGANVTVVYQVSSPVATGGLYQVIGYGTIEPRELPPGGTDEDQMDCDGCWRIPKTSAWKKQWHNFRACLRTDGAAPTPSTGDPSPGEVCAVYSRYSKE